MIDFHFIINSILFGAGLAMDAFSVSIANGLNEPGMRKRRAAVISGTFAFFQFAMPLAGWFCVHTIVRYFSAIDKFVPLIGFVLLLFIGIKMILDSVRGKPEDEKPAVGFFGLVVQGIATSIDALSVGFTIADYPFYAALIEALIIAAVTFAICFAGCVIGKKVGSKFADKAGIAGGLILIFIAAEILIKFIMHR